MDFMAPFLKSLTFLSFSPSSALQFHLYIPYLHSSTCSAPFQLLCSVLGHHQVLCQRHPAVSNSDWPGKLIWRAGAGGQSGFGEAGWAHTTPGDHSDHCSVLSPGQAKSPWLRAGKNTLARANLSYTSLKEERLQHLPAASPVGWVSHEGRQSKVLQHHPCRTCAP